MGPLLKIIFQVVPFIEKRWMAFCISQMSCKMDVSKTTSLSNSKSYPFYPFQIISLWMKKYKGIKRRYISVYVGRFNLEFLETCCLIWLFVLNSDPTFKKIIGKKVVHKLFTETQCILTQEERKCHKHQFLGIEIWHCALWCIWMWSILL